MSLFRVSKDQNTIVMRGIKYLAQAGECDECDLKGDLTCSHAPCNPRMRIDKTSVIYKKQPIAVGILINDVVHFRVERPDNRTDDEKSMAELILG
jgi:hypothetical protein